MNNKAKYLFRSITNFFEKKECPYCKKVVSVVIDRKWLVTTLNKCNNCCLYYRHPLDSIAFNEEFYQEDYEQKDGITTDLPSDDYLAKLIKTNFSGISKDYTDKISMLKRLAFNNINLDKPSIIDFGANWGYTSYQLSNAGFNVQSYEISQSRAKFGSKLGVDIFTQIESLKGLVDIFFSSHVIEHLPDIKSMFVLAQKLIKEDGFFVAFSPNGSKALQKAKFESFHKQWGEVHPNYLNNLFYMSTFKDVPYLIGTENSDPEMIKNWDQNTQTVLDLSGNELFVFAKIKNQKL